MPEQQANVGLGTKLAYGVGSAAYGVKDNGFNYLLLFYYNQVLGLPAAWVGAAIFIALLVDAISDPLVGYLSDNLHSRLGRRHPFMYAAALPVAFSYFLLWNPPQGLSQIQLFAYLLFVAIAVRTLITFYEIPATAMVAELTDDYDERTSLLSFRYFFGWWGGLTMAVLAYLVFFPEGSGIEGIGQLSPEGYHSYGRVASLVIAVAILMSASGTHHRIPTLKPPPPPRPMGLTRTLRELRETLAIRSFMTLFGGTMFYAMAAGLNAALSIYIATFFFGLETQQIGYLNIPYFGSAAVALIVAPILSRKLGKKRSAIATALAAVFMAPVAIGLRLLDWFPANGTDLLFYTLMGFYSVEVALMIISTALLSAMVADVVEESELATGRRSEGVFFAARSFAYKSVSGAGILLSTLLLTLIDFPRNATDPSQVDPAVVERLGMVYAPSIVLLYLIAVGFYSAYKIDRRGHEENLRRLAEAS